MRSLVLRAGTVAGVVAVLALPTTAARAATTAPSLSTASTAGTGRIVSGEALALAVVAPAAAAVAGPTVQRRPLGTGVAATGYAATEATT